MNTQIEDIKFNSFGKFKRILLPKNLKTYYPRLLFNCKTSPTTDEKCKYFVKCDGDLLYDLIKNGVLYSNKMNRHVTIRPCFKRILDYSFHSGKLTTISIPSSVERIGFGAFALCKKLRSVNFEANSKLKVIGEGSFKGCESLRRLDFPASLREIQEWACGGFSSLRVITFPNDSQLEKLCDSCFHAIAIKELILPGTLQQINGNLLKGIKTLRRLSIGEGKFKVEKVLILTSDGTEVVSCAARIKIVEIPSYSEGVRVIKENAFNCCEIDTLIIPSSVEIFEKRAFLCSDIGEIIFKPDSHLQEIGAYAFENCSLAFLDLPQSVTMIDIDAFVSNDFESLTIDNEYYETDSDKIVWTKDHKGIIFCPEYLKAPELVIDCEVIYGSALANLQCETLEFGKDLLQIGSLAFSFASIDTVQFHPDSCIEYWGINIFLESNIEVLVFPKSIDKIEENSIDVIKLEFVEHTEFGKFQYLEFSSIEVVSGPRSMEKELVKFVFSNPFEYIPTD